MDYEKGYRLLFNEITDAINECEKVLERLKDAQRKTEEMYIGNE